MRFWRLWFSIFCFRFSAAVPIRKSPSWEEGGREALARFCFFLADLPELLPELDELELELDELLDEREELELFLGFFFSGVFLSFFVG